MSFSDKITELKNKITTFVSASEEAKTTNIEKITSIKTRIVTIKESVANILSIKEQFTTASSALEKANAEIAECEQKNVQVQATLDEMKTDYENKKKELEKQVENAEINNNEAMELVEKDYQKQIETKTTEISDLQNKLSENIEAVNKITSDASEEFGKIEQYGTELGDALVSLETEVDGLGDSLKETEETVKKNPVQPETVPMAPVETTENASDDETSVTSGQTTVEDTSSVASSEPVGTEREQLIKKIKHEYLKDKKDAAEQGNLDPEGKLKLQAVEKLRSWDTNNRDRPELGSKFGLKDTLPGDKTYISTAHLGLTEGKYRGGGSKKRKQTRKKRKAKKTQKRNKKSSRK